MIFIRELFKETVDDFMFVSVVFLIIATPIYVAIIIGMAFYPQELHKLDHVIGHYITVFNSRV